MTSELRDMDFGQFWGLLGPILAQKLISPTFSLISKSVFKIDLLRIRKQLLSQSLQKLDDHSPFLNWSKVSRAKYFAWNQCFVNGYLWRSLVPCGLFSKNVNGNAIYEQTDLLLGFRVDSAFASIYDEQGVEIENSELLFTDQGVYVYKSYTSGHPFDTSEVRFSCKVAWYWSSSKRDKTKVDYVKFVNRRIREN